VLLEINALLLFVRVDEASKPVLALRSNLLGTWPFPVGKRVVELRRVRSLDVARNELWVNGVKVPHSREAIPWRKASVDARCKLHPMSVATIECGVCSGPACADCRAVDGVRCTGCFERAVEELRKEDRSKRLKGLILSGVLIFAIALYGLVAESRKALTCALGATVLFAFLVIHGTIRERMEARALLGTDR
jgi:hypothetical protein